MFGLGSQIDTDTPDIRDALAKGLTDVDPAAMGSPKTAQLISRLLSVGMGTGEGMEGSAVDLDRWRAG